jgi:hypothetical protein
MRKRSGGHRIRSEFRPEEALESLAGRLRPLISAARRSLVGRIETILAWITNRSGPRGNSVDRAQSFD